MLKKLQSKREEGFTIIEVLIVMAIAGLILLIVFLAVPALQRNSRNTSIKNDVQNVLGGVAEYQGANSGKMPTGVSGTGTVNFTGAAGTTPTSINIQGSTTVSSTAAAPAAAAPAGGTIVVSIGFRCDGTANARAVAALYSIETTAAAPVRQCAES